MVEVLRCFRAKEMRGLLEEKGSRGQLARLIWNLPI